MQEEQLFGVPLGAVTSIGLTWRQAPDGTQQHVRLEIHWQSRKPSWINVEVPDDHQLGGYVSRCIDVLINGAWMHRGRLALSLRKVADTWVDQGGEVSLGGSRLPRPH